MARKVLLETTYTFTPSSRTVTFPRIIPHERLVLITNVTTNQVIYNFSDPNLRATSYTTATSAAAVETTTVVLNYNTTSMSASDKLQITIDEYEERFTPAETLTDPVGKLRVSEPQSLIDTDFEYGTQGTKWESVSLLNNKASAFYDSTSPLTITNISGTGTRVVTVATTTPPAAGTPVFIQESTNTVANGWYLVDTVTPGVNFTYVARANVTNGTMFDSTKTFVFSGTFFTSSAITVSATAGAAFSASGTVVTVTTTSAHGLTIGDGIFVSNTTGATPAINGSWTVRTVPTSNTFTFDVISSTTGTITATGGTQNLYQRAFGFTVHRPYDGGVNFSAGTPYHGNQLVRQTRRYFRYQSGKGIQFSTGTILRSALQVDSLTSSGTTVTVTCKFPHNLATTAVGVSPTITVSGATPAAYNGTFTITGFTDTTFTYTAASAPGVSPATGFPIIVTPTNWWGSRIRVGMFDELNGFFFEYDGQTLYAVRRSSTDQLTGTVAIVSGSPVVTGTNTRFADQVVPGEYVVMRGMPYMVVSVTSNTQMIVSPEYRGASVTGNLIIAKRTDTRAAQSTWNIDRCDGTGPSGFSLDLGRMQMLYVDYSWYGAGMLRFGFRNQRGDIIYAHRIPNANYRTEAYMRSGNLPARYECNTQPPFTYLTASLANAATSMTVADTSLFPSSGYLTVQAAGNTGATVEYLSYTGKTATTFTGLTRALTNISGPLGLANMGGTSTAGGGTFTYSTTAPIQVSLHNATFTPVLSHWGSSVIMDGRFDDDKSFIFTSGMPGPIGIASNTTNALMSIRLAPSVDNGITGVLGAREVVNRMQLTLRSMGALANGTFLINVVLNGRVSSGIFSGAGGSSLSQIAQHSPGTTLTGGETIYAFYSTNGGGSNFDVTTSDLNLVRDLGNSIMGGAANNTCPTTANNLYPDGPDIVTITARNVGIATASIAARLSWTEAQA
jgi:hypothetical protein